MVLKGIEEVREGMIYILTTYYDEHGYKEPKDKAVADVDGLISVVTVGLIAVAEKKKIDL